MIDYLPRVYYLLRDAAARLSQFADLRGGNFVVLDVETTDHVVDSSVWRLAAIAVHGFEVIDSYSQWVRIARAQYDAAFGDLDEDAREALRRELHMDWNKIESGIPIVEALSGVEDFVAKYPGPVVSHNGYAFDLPVLTAEARRSGSLFQAPLERVLDTGALTKAAQCGLQMTPMETPFTFFLRVEEERAKEIYWSLSYIVEQLFQIPRHLLHDPRVDCCVVGMYVDFVLNGVESHLRRPKWQEALHGSSSNGTPDSTSG
ncbi:MAG: hypothetical protein WC992_00400 [Acholeplasmataceae bacterium]